MSSIAGLLSSLELSESHSEPTNEKTTKHLTNSQAATLALHQEIEALYADIHGDGKELAKRQEVIQRFSAVLTAANPNIEVEYFGSTLTGLFVRGSDIDLVVNYNVLDAKKAVDSLDKVREQLEHSLQVSEIELVSDTTIPVLKITDVESGIKLHISCATSAEPNPGIRTSAWVKQAIPGYPNLPKLLTVVKELLHRLGIPDIRRGGISSYALTLMTISFLQLHARPTDNLDDLLLKFLKLYGQDFNYQFKTIVIAKGGEVVSKIVARWPRGRFSELPSRTLSIQDPVNPRKDVGRPSYIGAVKFQKVLGLAYNALQKKINQSVADGDASAGSYLEAIYSSET